MARELLTWTCSRCGKTITSLYQRQLDQNKKAHLDKHEEDYRKEQAMIRETLKPKFEKDAKEHTVVPKQSEEKREA